jgi:predicted nucleic acid-binding protein
VTDLVIDASVAIKWVIEEHGTREAIALRRHRLFAPELLVAECANVLWKKTRRNELTLDEARLAARLLQRADIELAPMRALLEPATELAIAMDHPAYDCAYLALAESLTCDLVTADGKLSAKQLPQGYRAKVLGLTTSALP